VVSEQQQGSHREGSGARDKGEQPAEHLGKRDLPLHEGSTLAASRTHDHRAPKPWLFLARSLSTRPYRRSRNTSTTRTRRSTRHARPSDRNRPHNRPPARPRRTPPSRPAHPARIPRPPTLPHGLATATDDLSPWTQANRQGWTPMRRRERPLRSS
jgi:hypothetical protein